MNGRRWGIFGIACIFFLLLKMTNSRNVWAGEVASDEEVLQVVLQTETGYQYVSFYDTRQGIYYHDPKENIEELSIEFVSIQLPGEIMQRTLTGNFYFYTCHRVPGGKQDAYTSYDADGIASDDALPVFTEDMIFSYEIVGWKLRDCSYEDREMIIPYPGNIYSYETEDAMEGTLIYETYELSRDFLLGQMGLREEAWCDHAIYEGAQFLVSALIRCSADGQRTWSCALSLNDEYELQIAPSKEYFVRQADGSDLDLSGSEQNGILYSDDNLEELLLYEPKRKYEVLQQSEDGSTQYWTPDRYHYMVRDQIEYPSIWTEMTARTLIYSMNRSLFMEPCLEAKSIPIQQESCKRIQPETQEIVGVVTSKLFDPDMAIPANEMLHCNISLPRYLLSGEIVQKSGSVIQDGIVVFHYQTSVKSNRSKYYRFSYQIPGKIVLRFQREYLYSYEEVRKFYIVQFLDATIEGECLTNTFEIQEDLNPMQPILTVEKPVAYYEWDRNARYEYDLGVIKDSMSRLDFASLLPKDKEMLVCNHDTVRICLEQDGSSENEWRYSCSDVLVYVQGGAQLSNEWKDTNDCLVDCEIKMCPNGAYPLGVCANYYGVVWEEGKVSPYVIQKAKEISRIQVVVPVAVRAEFDLGKQQQIQGSDPKEDVIMRLGKEYALCFLEEEHMAAKGYQRGFFDEYTKHREVIFSLDVIAFGKKIPAGERILLPVGEKTMIFQIPMDATEGVYQCECRSIALNFDGSFQVSANTDRRSTGANCILSFEVRGGVIYGISGIY